MLTTTHTKGAKKFKAMEPLIRYIEEAMMDSDANFVSQVEWISMKHEKLEQVYKEGTMVYNEKVKLLLVGAKLIELIALNRDFDRLTANLKECIAIKDLSEEAIFMEYKGGIQNTGTKPFIGFSKENTETFYRLKLRSIESRIGQGTPQKV